MATFTPYQVDFSIKNAAKNLGFSKKRVSFKFGFANEKALKEGLTGPACRGSEHELTLIWSLGSGKRQLLLDNKDVHFSESGQNGWTTDHTWKHAFSLHEKATKQVFRFHFISQPPNKDRPEIQPFDLRVGGLSYFQFNPIYELGTPKMIIMPVLDSSVRRAASPLSAEERRQLAAAKLASLADLRNNPANSNENENTSQADASASGLKREEVSLINFEADEPPPPIPTTNPYGQQPVTSSGGSYPYFASSVTMDPAIDENVTAPGSTVYGTNPYGAPPPPQQPPNPYFGGAPFAAPQPQAFAAAPFGAPPPPPAGALPPSQASVEAGFQNPSFPPQPPAGYPQQPPSDAGAFQVYGAAQQAPYPAQQQQQALAPYQHAPPVSNPYVDPTGRVGVQQQQQQQPYNNYSLTSPSAQSQFSYGSAPSFAQPPPHQNAFPPQQQQQKASYDPFSQF